MEGLRAAVGGSGGVVARFPGLLCVARGPASAVHRLLQTCAEVAAGTGCGPGRPLGRRLAAWLAGPEAPEDLAFGTLAEADGRWAVFLHGPVTLRLPDMVISGADAATWTDRLVPPVRDRVRLAIDDEEAAAPGHQDAAPGARGPVSGRGAASSAAGDIAAGPNGPAEGGEEIVPDAADLLDLRAGVVAGSAVTLVPVAAAVSVEPVAGTAGPGAGTPSGRAAPVPPAAQPVSDQPASAEPAPVPVAAPRPAADQPAAAEPADVGAPVPPFSVVAPPVPPSSSQQVPAPQPSAQPDPQRPVPAVEPPPAVLSPPVLAPPRRAERIHGHPARGPHRSPLGDGRRAAPRPVGASRRTPLRTAEPVARGYLCSRGHLNDPRSHFCVLCGIRMNERTGVLVVGPRPPLGLLVFDDGSAFTVDAEYLIGRMPEPDERVRSGALRPLTVFDRDGAVSRVHAEIRVRGWDVVLVDSGSRNGTYVVPPGGQAWTPVPPHQSHLLVPGTRVRLGTQRTFVFESPSGVR